MSGTLTTAVDIVRFCRQARQLPPDRRGDALTQLMGIDWSRFPKEVSDFADDTEFFLLFGADRDEAESAPELGESKRPQDQG